MTKARIPLFYRAWIIYLTVAFITWMSGCGAAPAPDNPDPTPPAAPSNLTAQLTISSVGLSWDDNSNNELGFKVEKKITSSGTWVEIGNTGANIRNYTDNSTSNPGAEYFYRARAYNLDGNSNYSNEAVAQIPDAVASIGQAGGTVEVTDASSPLFGIKLTVPADTVQTQTTFTINHLNSEPPTPLPAGVSQDGPIISLMASTQLLGPVVADIPFASATEDSEINLFFHYDENSLSWETVDPLPTLDPTKRKMLLRSFSQYVKGRVQITSSSIDSGFSFAKDVLAANNDTDRGVCVFDNGQVEEHGICAGMSLVAERYFNKYAALNQEGLKCWWDTQTSWDVSCAAHGVYNMGQKGILGVAGSLIDGAGLLVGTVSDDLGLIVLLKYRLSIGKITAISMYNVFPFYGHVVDVVGWEKTGAFTGQFIVYDNENNLRTDLRMTYFKVGPISRMTYIDANGDDYDTFTRASSYGFNALQVDQIIEDNPREKPCIPINPIFEETFESSTVGTVPIDWNIIYLSNGSIAATSSAQAYEGTKSIQLQAQLAGTASISKMLPYFDSGEVRLTIYGYIDAASWTDTAGGFSMVNITVGGKVCWILFGKTGSDFVVDCYGKPNITARFAGGLNSWFKCDLVIDYDANIAKYYINGSLIGTTTPNTSPGQQLSLYATSKNGIIPVYYDRISIEKLR